jgi:hypothetical protein
MAPDFNILGHINRIHEILLFLTCFCLFSLQYSCPTNHRTQLGYPHTILRPLQPLSCLLYTLSISHYLFCSTQYYRVMSMCGAKQSLNNLWRSHLHFSCRPGSIIVSNWVQLNMSWNEKWIEWFLRNINQPGIHGPVKISISLIILTISGGYKKWFVIDNLYIVKVDSRRCFSRILPQLTHFVDKFEISSTVPDCCIPQFYKRTLSPVE